MVELTADAGISLEQEQYLALDRRVTPDASAGIETQDSDLQ